MIRNTYLHNSENDIRRLDLITSDIDNIYSKKSFFMNITYISSVTNEGVPKPRATTTDGSALTAKDNDTKNIDYPDIERTPHAALLSLSVETYGR